MGIGRILFYIIEHDGDALISRNIQNFNGILLAENKDSELYGKIYEVNGFKFLNLKILGPYNIHVYNGCQVIFSSDKKTKEIESDSLEIFSDYSKKLKLGITSFDIDLEETLETDIRQNEFQNILILIDKNPICFAFNHLSFMKLFEQPMNNDEGKGINGNEKADPYGTLF